MEHAMPDGHAITVQVDKTCVYIFDPGTGDEVGPFDLDTLRWLQATALPAASALLAGAEDEAAEPAAKLPEGVEPARDEGQIEGQLAIEA